MTVICKSTRYGEGCGHPVDQHGGTGACCCCNWQHNDPAHVDRCARCKPILDAYLARQREAAERLHVGCGHAFGRCRFSDVRA